jgi:hypothetical protein
MSDLERTIRETLRQIASQGETITYRDLAARAEVPPPHTIHTLTLLLEDLVREDHAAGRPLLAAVAVSRAQAGVPGAGFFQLLSELGRYGGPDRGAEAAAVHADELQAAWAYWGRPHGGG